MLNLQSSSSPDWVVRAQHDLPALLIDHAHCEKKAAGTAVNMIFSYVDKLPLLEPLSEIAQEELQHFQMVLNLLSARGITFYRQPPSSYGKRLATLVRKGDPDQLIDRCLIAALIEARSCERFGLLRDHLADKELADFYGSLYASEARHNATYIKLAQQFAPAAEVSKRLFELAKEEAEIIALGDPCVRVHS